MKEIDYNRLRELISRFDQCLTSNAEEQEIYAAYASGQTLPPELEALREMFSWYGSMGQQPSQQPEIQEQQPAVINVSTDRPRWMWLRIASYAAMICVLFAVGYIYVNRNGSTDFLESGYVIRHGVKYTDMAQVRQAMSEMTALVDASQAEMTEALEEVAEQSPREIVSSYIDMSDPAHKAVLDRIFPEE